MAKLGTDFRVGVVHPRENIIGSGTLGSLNAEVVIYNDGGATVSIDLRGTFVSTFEVSGTVDGSNWTLIPIRGINTAAVGYVTSVTVAGTYIGKSLGFRQVRVRCTAYTSGSTVTTICSSLAADDGPQTLVTTTAQTAVGASGAAVTLNIASPGAGLRHYLTYLTIDRFAAALLTAAAAPVTVTTTNIPGTPAFSFPAEAAPQGTIFLWREDFAYPIATTAQATATTVVCPATTNVIWRVTAGYFVAP